MDDDKRGDKKEEKEKEKEKEKKDGEKNKGGKKEEGWDEKYIKKDEDDEKDDEEDDEKDDKKDEKKDKKKDEKKDDKKGGKKGGKKDDKRCNLMKEKKDYDKCGKEDKDEDEKDEKDEEEMKLKILRTCPKKPEKLTCPQPDLWRFSRMNCDRDLPFYEMYNPLPDPIKCLTVSKKTPKCTCSQKKFECKDMIRPKEPKPHKCRPVEYIAPKPKKWLEEDRKRHKKEAKKYNYYCTREIIRVDSPIDLRKMSSSAIGDFMSIDKGDVVDPDKCSLTDSMYKCVKKDKKELELKVPKSTIFINRKKEKDKDGKGKKTRKHKEPVDSFDYIYNPQYRKRHKEFVIFRADDKISQISVASEMEDEELRVIDYGEYDGEEGEEEKKRIASKASIGTKEGLEVASNAFIKSNQKITSSVSEYTGYTGEEGEEAKSNYSVHSAFTEIDSAYKIKDPVDSDYDMVAPVVSKMVQKYKRDSEICVPIKQAEAPPQRGTLQSHSMTKIKPQPCPFFYGSTIGTLHQGSTYFSEQSRNRQGLSNCVSAYVYSFVKPPNRWTNMDVDKVLEIGDDLYLTTVQKNHLHTDRAIKPKELYDIVSIDDIKIKYKIHDPDIAGITKSEDPKIFDLMKGLILFFDRYRAGILQTCNSNILIWKRKHYFVFDPMGRDSNLYMDEEGSAILANFYDLHSIMIMLIERGNIENSPFIISRISVKKIIRNDEDEKGDGDSITSGLRKDSEYKIISCTKAVVCGKIHVEDPCFKLCKSQQVFCVVLMSLIYYHITPAAAWHSKTLDKFLIVGNQFYQECIKEMNTEEFKLENIPAFFTIGPITVELKIFANQHAGFMYKKGICLFDEMLRNFFKKHTTALVEIDKYILGIWRQRNYYYMFDPYSRGRDALTTTHGAACVSMNGSLRSLVETVTQNFNTKEYIFKIHALKLLKLNRDPDFTQIDSEMDVINSIQIGPKRALFETKPISVDITETAIKTSTQPDISLGPSIIEVASGIESIDQKFVQNLPTQCVQLDLRPTLSQDVIYDLDSPSLSDTQIPGPKPDPNVGDDGMALKHLEELEKEQIELEKFMEMPGEDFDFEGLEDMSLSSGEVSPAEEEFEEGEGEDYFRDIAIQKGKDKGFNKETAEMNTDLLGISPFPRILLEPTDMSKQIKAKRHAMKQYLFQQRIPQEDKEITPLQELQRKSNFETLPDGSYIIYGSFNIGQIEEFEEIHPYCSVMAIAMMRKYSLHTWTTEVIDTVMACGYRVYKGLNMTFSEFHQLDIPQVVIGSSKFSICVQHVFDSLLDRVILESAIEKILLKRFCMGVVACKIYSVAVFIKRGVYYMYDCFGNSRVGLGEGPENTGVACLFRFKTLDELVGRFMYNKSRREVEEPTEATRFVITAVKVSNVFDDMPMIRRKSRNVLEHPPPEDDAEEEEEEDKEKKEPKNVIGYKKRGEYCIIRGTKGLTERSDITGDIKVCHFVCTCALLGLLCKQVNKWSRKRVDYIIDSGMNLVEYIDNMKFADKRSIKNLLIDEYFFDIIIKRVRIVFPDNCRSNAIALKYILSCKHKYLLLQFLNCCYVLYRTDKYYHLFDPYGIETPFDQEEVEEEEENPDKGKAAWIRFTTMNKLQKYLQDNTIHNSDCFFFTIHVSNFRKASKWRRLSYKLRLQRKKKKLRAKEKYLKLNENENWLEIFPIPWSHMTRTLAHGPKRGFIKWYHWDVEYPNDLFSLVGTLHQTSKGFSRISRGKQTIANCIVAIIMTEIYSFPNWNSSVLSSILRNGDLYFRESICQIDDENHELRIEDFKKELVVAPYNVKIKYTPIYEGTMFVIQPRQYNLSKALRCFFEVYENRHGIIACSREGSKTKFLAFGRVQFGEYYMYDCQTIGPPMFMDKFRSASYILRCLCLNRLLYVMTLTLRGGDFFIYEVKIVPPKDEDEEREGDDQSQDDQGRDDRSRDDRSRDDRSRDDQIRDVQSRDQMSHFGG